MELKLELESTPEASAEARDELRLLEGRIPDQMLSDLLLIVTELITNSVKFGPGLEIELRLDVGDDGSVQGLIVDGGRGRVAIRDTPVSEPGGFGLQIVDTVASRWGVRPNTSDVWFELASADGGNGRMPAARRARSRRMALAGSQRRLEPTLMA